MTVIRPNSIAGINSITVQSGQALNVHDATGNLIRSLTNESGISTFSGINIGTAATIFANGNATFSGIVTATIIKGSGSLTSLDVTSGLGIAESLFHLDDINTRIAFPSNDTISFDTDNTERLRILSSGNVGLGTTNPTSLLHMYGAAPRITLTDTAGSDDFAKIFSTSGALYLQQRDGTAHGEIIFRTENNSTASERLRISNVGALGIAGANYGTSGQVLTSGGSGAAPSWATAAGGIQDFDRWHLTADTSGNTDPISNNWSRWTSYGGTGTVTFAAPSSGLWTFPSTGFWHIDWFGMFTVDNKAERGCNLYIYVTTNDSSYSFVNASETSAHDSSAVTKTFSRCTYVFDVTSTSTHKVKFAVGYNQSSNTLHGHGTYLESNVCFTKLRDT